MINFQKKPVKLNEIQPLCSRFNISQILASVFVRRGITSNSELLFFLEDNLRVARKDRENLQLKVGKDLKEFIKDCPYSALKLYANGCYVEQFEKAKEMMIEKMKCCENCADYDGQDCDADNENYCRCFTGDKNDDCYWRLKED